MTAQRLAANRVVPARDPGGDAAARAVHDAGLQPRADLARSGPAPDRAADLSRSTGRRRDARDALDGVRRRDAALQRRLDAGAVCDAAAAAAAAARTRRASPRVAADLAFNTAASFTTNTNWQAYGGETTMSYLTQMAGLAYHNFVSAAAGIALAIAFIRGIAQREKDTIGNFWVDLSARRSGCCCRSASSARCSWSRRASSRTLQARTTYGRPTDAQRQT